MRVTTNEAATCKWDTALGTAYAAMASTFATTGGTSHNTVVNGLADGRSYTYPVRCQDGAGNPNATDYLVSFNVGTGPGPISPSLVPSRTSGVAPLSVFFDATGTTDTAVTSHPFHDLEYRWDFGDPAGGATWAYGARPGVSSKNVALGPVAAHVFESPGTYTVALSAFDGVNTVTTNTTITVSDPDTVFSGTHTVCVSSTTDPTPGAGGCPAGAAHHQQADFVAIISSYACTGCRVLLKRGDTFTDATEARLSNTGPGIVGAYGTGARPHIRSTGARDQSTMTVSSPGNHSWSDWRVMDLDFDGERKLFVTGLGVSAAGGGTIQLTLLRLKFSNFATSLGFALDGLDWVNNRDGNTMTVDQLAVVECESYPNLNTAISSYNSGNRIAFLGNYFDGGAILQRYDENGVPQWSDAPTNSVPSPGSHVLRFPYCYKCVVSNNDLRRPGGSRHHIKLHAPFRHHATPPAGEPNSDCPDAEHGGGCSWSNYSPGGNWSTYTEQVVISDNLLVSSTAPWDIAVSPQDSGEDERLRDVILERNFHQGVTTNHQCAQVIRARRITSRNNILTEDSAGYSAFAQVDVDGAEPPASDVWIYNNTMYKSNAGAAGSDGFAIVNLPDAPVSNVTIRNNLGFAPNATGAVPYVDIGIAGLVASNNSTTAQIATSPLFAGTASPVDFVPGPGSYAIGAGAAVPVWSDFFLNGRPLGGAMEMGAVEVP